MSALRPQISQRHHSASIDYDSVESGRSEGPWNPSRRAEKVPRSSLMMSTTTSTPARVLLCLTGGAVAILVVMSLMPRSSLWVHKSVHLQGLSTAEGGAELLLVQAVFRHGARTPLNTWYWNETTYADCSSNFPGAQLKLVDEAGSDSDMSLIDLGQPKLPGGCRMGQLTSTGYHMAQDLGAWLRRRYVEQTHFLDKNFQAEQLWARSTRYQRTVQTLQGVITGLWPNHLDQPVTVRASDLTREYAYGNNLTCPALTPIFDMLGDKVKERDQSDAYVAHAAAVVSEALSLPGGPPAVQWVRLHDVLAAMAAQHGGKLPQGATPKILDMIMQQAVSHEAPVIAPTPSSSGLAQADCDKTNRLSIGTLLWHMQDNMQQKAIAQHGRAASAASPGAVGRQLLARHTAGRRLGRAQRTADPRRTQAGGKQQAAGKHQAGGKPEAEVNPAKLFLYSGHDSTITPFLAVLGTPETMWPPFTAVIVWELWRAPPDVLWVRVLYNRQPLDLSRSPGLKGKASATAGRSLSDGWVQLTDLTALLLPVTASDAQHAVECAA